VTGLFRPTPQVLRDYQSVALDAIRAKLRAGARSILLVAPTGSGKTTIAAEMIRGAVARQGAVLFLAHRKELIDQCSARLDGVGVEHGIIQAGHRRVAPSCPVQVASVPTLVKRLDRLPRATLIIVDEAHHARAGTYGAVLGGYPGVPIVGLSATPWRLDNRGLGELFEALVVASTPRELIAAGHLVPFTGFAYDVPDLGKVKKVGADYNQAGLELVMGRAQLAGNIVEQWLLHCAGKRTVCFCVTVQHSKDLTKRFTDAGVKAEHLDGATPLLQREGILARLASGATQVVCNCNVLSEGFDCPQIEAVVLARPTLSVGMYLQFVGRGMRPAPGKSVLRIHDHAGLILRHGLPDQDRDYTLSRDPKKKSDRLVLPPVKTCKQCFAIYPAAARACPACGYENETQGRQIQEIEQAEAIPLEDLQHRINDERSEFLETQMRIAQATGKKPGWAAWRYKERFGNWPEARFWSRIHKMDPERVAELSARLSGMMSK
jgi:DNA repair protein RadD